MPEKKPSDLFEEKSDLFKEAKLQLDQAEEKFKLELKHYEDTEKVEKLVSYNLSTTMKDGVPQVTLTPVYDSNTTAPPLPMPSADELMTMETEQLNKYKAQLKKAGAAHLYSAASVYTDEPQEEKMINEDTGEEMEDEPEGEKLTKMAYRDRYATRAQALRKYVHAYSYHPGEAPSLTVWQKVVKMVDALPTSPVLPKSKAEDQVRAIRVILKINGIDSKWVPSSSPNMQTERELRVLEGIRLILSGKIATLDQYKRTGDEHKELANP
jgi:hypothetical protein